MSLTMELGDNVKVLARDESHAILEVKDDTGEGLMTMYTPFAGVYINISDMHMQQCNSGFLLEEDADVVCFDHCKEGRIELETSEGVYSVLQEKQLRIDDRRHHSGHVVMPLNHFHGISIYIDLAPQGIAAFVPEFSVDIHRLRDKFCKEGEPYNCYCILMLWKYGKETGKRFAFFAALPISFGRFMHRLQKIYPCTLRLGNYLKNMTSHRQNSKTVLRRCMGIPSIRT